MHTFNSDKKKECSVAFQIVTLKVLFLNNTCQMLILNFSLLVLTNGVWNSSRSKYVFPVYDSRFSQGTVGKLGKISRNSVNPFWKLGTCLTRPGPTKFGSFRNVATQTRQKQKINSAKASFRSAKLGKTR